ncbi:hypothetical protein ESP131_16440 [Exiguobacterium sp. U13-1]|uniref:DUF1919 domain-containing protein n=1 Tax=Exiguobacterium sp. U13-1 TaxID=1849031 RepID=UPI0008596D9F|nr:DUF1919 domain-containing protein [Exiguobacterium sp. U13-1]AOT01786.1 hypothetical protein ESP131_16440 [Exiguobacterium sp. U13-1]
MRKFKIYRAISKFFRIYFVNKRNENLLENENFTILSNNCVGSLITNDLNHKFLTPTVNLFMSTNDFVKLISNLDYYLKLEIIKVDSESKNYPIGMLDDITIHFMHYKNITEAKKKWNERKQRIVKENLFILMVDNDDCSEETFRKFKDLSYKKVFLTNKQYKKEKFVRYIHGFENDKYLGDLSMYQNILGKRYYDQFNYIDWLNNKI